MTIPVDKRYAEYKNSHCWQYDIRLNNLETDIKNSKLSIEEIKNLKVSHFEFKNITDKKRTNKND